MLLSGLLFLFLSCVCSAGDAHWYAFWPYHYFNDFKSPGYPFSNAEFEKVLETDGNNLYASVSEIVGEKGATWFWTALVDEDIVESKYKKMVNNEQGFELAAVVELSRDAALASSFSANVTSRLKSLPKRRVNDDSDGVIVQADAPRQLRFISMPLDPNKKLDDVKEYRYYESAGKGSRIYIMDGGLYPESSEWSNPEGREAEFLWGEPFSHHEHKDVDDQPSSNQYGHGTCMADLALGNVYGVAKKADITAAQYDDSVAPTEVILDTINKIANDIARRNIPHKTVIVMPFEYYSSEPTYYQFKTAFWEILTAVYAEWYPAMVVSMPNTNSCTAVPCIYGDPSNEHWIKELNTVGAVDLATGKYLRTEAAQQTWTTFWAPGDDSKVFTNQKNKQGMRCVAPTGNSNDVLKDKTGGFSGTSAAAAIVGGMMAYWQSFNHFTFVCRKNMLEDAYQRHVDGPKVVWNACGESGCST